MDESNVLDSGFLERMNTLLANGEVTQSKIISGLPYWKQGRQKGERGRNFWKRVASVKEHSSFLFWKMWLQSNSYPDPYNFCSRHLINLVRIHCCWNPDFRLLWVTILSWPPFLFSSHTHKKERKKRKEENLCCRKTAKSHFNERSRVECLSPQFRFLVCLKEMNMPHLWLSVKKEPRKRAWCWIHMKNFINGSPVKSSVTSTWCSPWTHLPKAWRTGQLHLQPSSIGT